MVVTPFFFSLNSCLFTSCCFLGFFFREGFLVLFSFSVVVCVCVCVFFWGWGGAGGRGVNPFPFFVCVGFVVVVSFIAVFVSSISHFKGLSCQNC